MFRFRFQRLVARRDMPSSGSIFVRAESMQRSTQPNRAGIVRKKDGVDRMATIRPGLSRNRVVVVRLIRTTDTAPRPRPEHCDHGLPIAFDSSGSEPCGEAVRRVITPLSTHHHDRSFHGRDHRPFP